MKEEPSKPNVAKLQQLVETVGGTYSRVARRIGLHRTFVSRVARGERRSELVEKTLAAEYEQIKKIFGSADLLDGFKQGS